MIIYVYIERDVMLWMLCVCDIIGGIAYVYICVYICVYIYIYIYIRVCYVHYIDVVYMCIYIYIYIYTHILYSICLCVYLVAYQITNIEAVACQERVMPLGSFALESMAFTRPSPYLAGSYILI